MLKRSEVITVDIDNLQHHVCTMSNDMQQLNNANEGMQRNDEWNIEAKSEVLSSSSGEQSPSQVYSMLIKRKREDDEDNTTDKILTDGHDVQKSE